MYSGKKNPSWNGGRIVTDQGYIRVRKPDHPRAVGGYVLEHILVMEEYLGRDIEIGEVIHHINGNRSDNRPENLKLYESNGEHLSDELSPKEPRLCKCGQPHKGHGLCARHLAQLKRTGETWDFENKYLETRGYPSCEVCGDKVRCRKLCRKHYRQALAGKIEFPK